ncbi:hypothetical protein SDC9_100339 [bioreactor metagenome]|uniref:Uncharacterized protein n=1 Tax=bioreactor metagenome TaxID=1076179 RepID=A0A645AMM6_9ZZZZ
MLTHQFALACGGVVRIAQAHRDVLLHRQPGEQAVVLEHDTPVQAGAGDLVAAQRDVAFVVGIEPQHQAQQRGLAAATGAHDADEFARRQMQVDVFQHLEAAVCGLCAVELL